MDVFLESPWPAIGLFGFALVALAVAYHNTRHRALLWVAALDVLLGIAGVGLEYFFVTDYEEVENALSDAAAALQSNDEKALLNFIAPEADSLRGAAHEALAAFEIYDAGFRGLEVRFNHVMNPPTATAQFRGRVFYSIRGGDSQRRPYLHPVTIRLRREGDRWLMTEVDMQGYRRM
jgi:ketosteroid isomerase-like protein